MVVTLAHPAAAHDERPTRALDGTGSVPTYRSDDNALLVCKTDRDNFAANISDFSAKLKQTNEQLWRQCQQTGFRDVQAAVDAADNNTTIKILPGLYQEEPSLVAPTGECSDLVGVGRSKLYQYQILSLAEQVLCPASQNLVAVINKQGIQIEGTGAEPEDVILDAQYKKLNALRADNADGFYLRNVTVQRSQFNAVYVLETDGFVLEDSVGRWNDEYGFLTFAVGHGLYDGLEGYGNGDSAFYPGSASDINDDEGYDPPRYSVEIRNSYGHHNMLGYSGTAGDSVWVHDNIFTQNSTGISTDSAFPDHPGMPQNHALFENNIIADNNVDYYRYFDDGTCQKPYAERGYEEGVVCPVVGVPVGAGAINPGGNYNTWRNNYIYNNDYAGFVTSWVPGLVRGDNSFAEQFDTSHRNRYLGNRMGVDEAGEPAPNGVDYWWDGQGKANCWDTADNSVSVSNNIGPLPSCAADERPPRWAPYRFLGEPTNTLKMVVCGGYNLQEGVMPSGCDWWGADAAVGLERIEVQWAIAEALVMTGLLAWLLLRHHGARRARWLMVVVTAAGFALIETGVWQTMPLLEALGLGLVAVGLGWGGQRMRRDGFAKLGGLSVLIAAFALVGAFDRGVVMLPLIPVSPALVRLVLELVWVLSALLAPGLQHRRLLRTAAKNPTSGGVT
jgi:hypothetical protein